MNYDKYDMICEGLKEMDLDLPVRRMGASIRDGPNVRLWHSAEAEGLGRLTKRVPNVRPNFGRMLYAKIKNAFYWWAHWMARKCRSQLAHECAWTVWDGKLHRKNTAYRLRTNVISKLMLYIKLTRGSFLQGHLIWWIITFSWKNYIKSRFPNYYVIGSNHFYPKGANEYAYLVFHVHNGSS